MAQASISNDEHMQTSGSRHIHLLKLRNGQIRQAKDLVACEEPLHMRLRYGPANQRQEQTLAILMRTPEHDRPLAFGLLFTEQIIHSAKEVLNLRYEQTDQQPISGQSLIIELAAEYKPASLPPEGPYLSGNSACGICSATVMEQLERQPAFILPKEKPRFTKSFVLQLPRKLQENQKLFGCTGGLHAAAVFTPSGKCLYRFEDVGRHNALDKLIGQALLDQQLPLHQHALILSGRISFELVQKAAMAGIAFICAIGAPSSAALQLAETHGITLIGFLKENSFNLYTYPQRIADL